MPPNASAAPSRTLTVFRVAALFTFLAVAMGSVVCATGSGAACATWPGCQPGQIGPGWHLSPIIEFSHRVVAVSSGPLVLAAAILSGRVPGSDRWVRVLPWIALAGAIAAGVFGRLVVLASIPTWAGAVDLFSALTAMTVMGISAVRAGSPSGSSSRAASTAAAAVSAAAGRVGDARERLVALLAPAAVAAVIALHVTGIFAAGKGSYTRCMGWPLWRFIGTDLHPWLQGVRLGLAGVGAVLVVATVVAAVRTERLRRFGIVVGVLFAAEMVLGQVIRAGALSRDLAAGYSVLAVALLWALGLLTATAGLDRTRGDVDSNDPDPRVTLRA